MNSIKEKAQNLKASHEDHKAKKEQKKAEYRKQREEDRRIENSRPLANSNRDFLNGTGIGVAAERYPADGKPGAKLNLNDGRSNPIPVNIDKEIGRDLGLEDLGLQKATESL